MNGLQGVVKNLPDADYRAAPGYGSTAIKWFLEEVPAQAKHWIDHPEDAPTFDAAAVGQLVHALVLGQPHAFVVKDWDGRTKEGKARAAEVEANGQVGLSQADFDLAHGMAAGVRRHPTVAAILDKPGSAECSVFATVDGVKCKARFDWLPDDPNLPALDLKTAMSANPRVFVKNVARFEYAVQRAEYLDVLEAVEGRRRELLIVAVDKRAPHLTSLVGVPEMWSQIASEKAARARRIIRECEVSGVWPGYGDGIHYIDAPTYYVFDADEQEITV